MTSDPGKGSGDLVVELVVGLRLRRGFGIKRRRERKRRRNKKRKKLCGDIRILYNGHCVYMGERENIYCRGRLARWE